MSLRHPQEVSQGLIRLLVLLPPFDGRDQTARRRLEGAIAVLDSLDGSARHIQSDPFVYDRRVKARSSSRERPLALAYLRVSTLEQAEGGASLEAQRELLGQECSRRGWDVEFVADEGFSAKDVTGRPGLTEALERLDAKEADVLLTLRVDRLSRSVADFTALMARAQKKHWSLAALDLGLDTSTPTGDLLAHVLASFAQYERKVIGQRTREAMAQRRQEGVHLGRPSRLPRSTTERIARERLAGATYAQIAEGLTADQVATAAGGFWHPATVRRVLQSSAGQQALQRPPDQPRGTEGVQP